MSHKLTKELYFNNTWMVDYNSFCGMWSMFQDLRSNNGVPLTDGEKCNQTEFYSLENKSLREVKDGWDLRRADNDEELIGVINLNGVITKEGGMSSYGTKQLARNLELFEKDSRVKGTIIKADSGGGSGVAIQFLTDAMDKAKKPIISFIEKGAMAASAAYGIISASDYIIAEKEDSQVGSLGTFIQMAGFPKDTTTDNNLRIVRVYAPDSTEKNENFEEAINNGNFKPIIENVLKPANKKFLDSIKSYRPNIQENQMKGKMFDAGDVLGSMVDEIGDFDLAVSKVLELSNTVEQNNNNNNFNNNSNNMNKVELQQKHPELYQSLLDEGFTNGVKSENGRYRSWNAYRHINPEKVDKGIQSGEHITDAEMHEFLAQGSKQTQLENLASNGAKEFTEEQSSSDGAAAETEMSKLQAMYDEL